jgi:hypothetical protein
VLATIPLAVIARQTRSAMLEVLGEDYVRTARSKGLSPLRVVGVHALRNAMIPVITTIGLQIGVLLGRRHPDRNDLLLAGYRQVDGRCSVFKRDYPVVQGGLLLIAGDHHVRQSHRRSALRLHQPADPALGGGPNDMQSIPNATDNSPEVISSGALTPQDPLCASSGSTSP